MSLTELLSVSHETVSEVERLLDGSVWEVGYSCGAFDVLLRTHAPEVLSRCDEYMAHLRIDGSFTPNIRLNAGVAGRWPLGLRWARNNSHLLDSVRSHQDMVYRRASLSNRSTLLLPDTGPSHAIFLLQNDWFILGQDAESLARTVIRSLRQVIMKSVENVGGAILHSSGIVSDGAAILFIGDSGSGKTTFLTKAMEEMHKDFLTNDRVAIMGNSDEFSVVGVPLAMGAALGTLENSPTLSTAYKNGYSFSRGRELSRGKLELTPLEIGNLFGVDISTSANLATAVFLHQAKGGGVRISELGWQQAALDLQRCLFTTRDTAFPDDWLGLWNERPETIYSRAKALTTCIARSTPCFKLTWSYESVGQVMDPLATIVYESSMRHSQSFSSEH